MTDVSPRLSGIDARIIAAIPPFSEEAIERAAEALYEHDRDPSYDGPEWDWPMIDRSYDREPDDDDGDPEWARNAYREQVMVVVRALGALA